MTVRELLSMCDECNYSTTRVSIYDDIGNAMHCLPGELPDKVKNAHVMRYTLGPLNGMWLTRFRIWIEERHIL